MTEATRSPLTRSQIAAMIGTPGNVLSTAVTALVTAIAQPVIDATATQAALAAVADAVVGLDLIEGGSFGDLYNADLVFTVSDGTGLRSWIEIAADGGPTDHALNAMMERLADPIADELQIITYDGAVSGVAGGVTDELGRRSWLETGFDGRPTPWAIQAIAEALGIATGALDTLFPSEDWVHWGDSLTAGSFPTILATLTGRNHVNNGYGGQTSTFIAARQGGTPPRLTFPANQIPASGAVTLTSMTNVGASSSTPLAGAVAGIQGTITTTDNVTFTFTRSIAGSVVDVPAGTIFISSIAQLYRGRTTTFWIGRNDFDVATPQHIVARLQSMLDLVSTAVKRVIIMEIPPWVGEEIGKNIRTRLDTCNAAIKAAFGAYYLDIATFLRSPAAAVSAAVVQPGFVFTSQDNTDIANGLTPTSFRADPGHPNSLGYAVIARRVFLEAQDRGWV